METMMLLRWRMMKAHILRVHQQLQSTYRMGDQPKQQHHQNYHQQLQQLKPSKFHLVKSLDDALSKTKQQHHNDDDGDDDDDTK
jgi:hypothetical protein